MIVRMFVSAELKRLMMIEKDTEISIVSDNKKAKKDALT